MDELLQSCSEVTGYRKQDVEMIVGEFLEQIVQELAKGHSVDLVKGFGVFSVKLRTSKLQENSPRTPKQSHYRVFFRENNGLRKRLKI